MNKVTSVAPHLPSSKRCIHCLHWHTKRQHWSHAAAGEGECSYHAPCGKRSATNNRKSKHKPSDKEAAARARRQEQSAADSKKAMARLTQAARMVERGIEDFAATGDGDIVKLTNAIHRLTGRIERSMRDEPNLRGPAERRVQDLFQQLSDANKAAELERSRRRAAELRRIDQNARGGAKDTAVFVRGDRRTEEFRKEFRLAGWDWDKQRKIWWYIWLGEDGPVTDERVFELMARAATHRSKVTRMRKLFELHFVELGGGAWPLPLSPPPARRPAWESLKFQSFGRGVLPVAMSEGLLKRLAWQHGYALPKGRRARERDARLRNYVWDLVTAVKEATARVSLDNDEWRGGSLMDAEWPAAVQPLGYGFRVAGYGHRTFWLDGEVG